MNVITILILIYLGVGTVIGILGVKMHQLNHPAQSQWYRLVATFALNLFVWMGSYALEFYQKIFSKKKKKKFFQR